MPFPLWGHDSKKSGDSRSEAGAQKRRGGLLCLLLLVGMAVSISVGLVSQSRAGVSAPSIHLPAYLTSANVGSPSPTVAVQGPGNSLWVYWQTTDAQWHGPLGVGGPGSTFSSPSIAFNASGQPTVAVQGPGNSLWVYWQTTDAQWHGPLGVGGPGSTFSSPSIAFNASGQPTVAVQGPSHSLWVYWQTTDAQWHGPLGVGGPGSTFSSPSIAFNASGQPTVAVQGPSNSLWVYWETPSAQWDGPLGVGGPGSNFSSPSIGFNSAGLPTVAVQGPGNSLWVYWEVQGGQWEGPLGVGGPGSTFSSPSIAFNASGLPTVAVQGPGNSLWVYWQTAGAQWDGPLGVGGPASNFSSPSIAFNAAGLPTVAVQGPGNSLWVYWEIQGGQWEGPLGVGGPGSTFSAPSLAAGVGGTQSSSSPVGLQLPPVALGSTGPNVLALQNRLSALGYWLGTPNGTFGDSTQQALYALQKAAQIPRTGTLTSATLSALNEGIVQAPRSTSGYVIEIDLEDDLLMVVDNGGVEFSLNTSTGGGYTYTDEGVTSVATTPSGQFQIYRQVDGTVVDSLGTLFMPKFFDAGFAIHGDSNVPPEPVSHGCARVSDEAISWIWANNIIPIGTSVWVY